MHCTNFLGTWDKSSDSLFWCLNDVKLEGSGVQSLYNTVYEFGLNQRSLLVVGMNRTIHLFSIKMQPYLLCILPLCFLGVLCAFCKNLIF